MPRTHIGDFLGLIIETVSRTFATLKGSWLARAATEQSREAY